jgi:pteridine reductase
VDNAFDAQRGRTVTLSGKIVLVTGGARRVGRAIVEEAAARGARVVVHHAHSPGEAEEVARSLAGAPGGKPVVVQGDLRAPHAAAEVVRAAVAACGRIDALVNSAAVYGRTPMVGTDDATWEATWADMMALNLAGPARLVRAALPHRLGAVVNIVDIAAWQPWPNFSIYSTSKAALLHLTRCLAVELAPTVRVNAVAPGTVLWPEEWDEVRRARQAMKIPLGRAGTPADVARAVAWLLEEEYVTGACLPIDGGAGLR